MSATAFYIPAPLIFAALRSMPLPEIRRGCLIRWCSSGGRYPGVSTVFGAHSRGRTSSTAWYLRMRDDACGRSGVGHDRVVRVSQSLLSSLAAADLTPVSKAQRREREGPTKMKSLHTHRTRSDITKGFSVPLTDGPIRNVGPFDRSAFSTTLVTGRFDVVGEYRA
jgi:hypothetical protein